MITNKDLSIDSKNGQVILNGDKYDLGTQGEIDAAVYDVYSVMGQMGAKNLIPRPYADGEEKTQKNMTYKVNTDGTITATATQALTGDATFYLYGPTDTEELVLKAGVKYVLSGDPTASGGERIVVSGRSAAGGPSETLIINNTGVPKEYTPDEDKVITSIYIRNYTSTPTPYNETFKPMIRLASDTDNNYQPFAMTNKQLTDELAGVETKINEQISFQVFEPEDFPSWDNLPYNAKGYAYSSQTNSPGFNGFVLCWGNSDVRIQVAFAYNQTGQKYRVYVSGSWGAWSSF